MHRRDRPPIILPAGIYVLAFRVLSRGYGGLGLALGLAILAGGADRFGARALATAREVPGGYVTWGVLAAAFGAAVLAGSLTRARRLVALATSAMTCWHLFFAVSLGLSALQDSRAGVTGAITYTGLAGLGWVLAAGVAEVGR
jgi:hypothetical protein